MKFLLFSAAMLASLPFTASAQRATWHSTTADGKTWNESTIKLNKPTGSNSILTVDDKSTGQTFRHWGTTFNELDWDAFVQLPRSVQDSMMYNM
ncbi:MAG: beta-glycosidase, partial [Muribaculaceae bacterium]|nr:beta-glycosidase [Muribaculaceae bacterium]